MRSQTLLFLYRRVIFSALRPANVVASKYVPVFYVGIMICGIPHMRYFAKIKTSLRILYFSFWFCVARRVYLLVSLLFNDFKAHSFHHIYVKYGRIGEHESRRCGGTRTGFLMQLMKFIGYVWGVANIWKKKTCAIDWWAFKIVGERVIYAGW